MKLLLMIMLSDVFPHDGNTLDGRKQAEGANAFMSVMRFPAGGPNYDNLTIKQSNVPSAHSRENQTIL